MRWIKFTESREYIQQGVVAQDFKAGESYELRDDMARRWVNRQVAEYCDPPLPKAAKDEPARLEDIVEPVAVVEAENDWGDEDDDGDRPTESQVRHMSKPDLHAYAERIGLKDFEDLTNKDLAELILAER